MRRILCSTFVLACSFAIAGCIHAPMPWSPDSRWIAYTVEVRPIDQILRPGWLFESPSRPSTLLGGSTRPTAYRLWATRKDTGASVLLEESDQPMTAPGWSPDGRALAFGKLVVPAEGPGRFEVVILEGPGRRRIVSSRPLTELNAEASRLPGQAVVWSPDGRYLAIPQLSPLGLAIIRADNGRQVNRIADAFLPSWAPDGARLAFYLRGTGDTLNSLDSPVGQPRILAEVGQAGQAPVWSRDGLTLFIASRKSVPRGADPPGEQVELIKVRADNGQSETIRSLAVDAVLGRDRSVEGVSIAFDGESLFCSSVVEGAANVLTWYHPRENEVYKKFTLVDFSAPMGSLSISPDGSALAARVGPVDRLGAPVICDLESSDPRSRLMAPDDASRVEWIATLVQSARTILANLPITSPEPNAKKTRPLDRPTLLPILGEFDLNSDPVIRLRKISKLGRPLCDRPADAPAAGPMVEAILDEARLFFDYLSGNYVPALKSLETLEARVESSQHRLGLLSVRAQISLAQGNVDQMGETVGFLRSLVRSPGRRIEWDGTAYRLTNLDPARGESRDWTDYLTWRGSKVQEILHDDGADLHFNPDNPRFNFGLNPLDPRQVPPFPDRPFFNDPARPAAPPRPRGVR